MSLLWILGLAIQKKGGYSLNSAEYADEEKLSQSQRLIDRRKGGNHLNSNWDR